MSPALVERLLVIGLPLIQSLFDRLIDALTPSRRRARALREIKKKFPGIRRHEAALINELQVCASRHGLTPDQTVHFLRDSLTSISAHLTAHGSKSHE